MIGHCGNPVVLRINGIREWFLLAIQRPSRALTVAFWYLAGKRVRARGQLADALSRLPFRYTDWLKNCAADDNAVLSAFADDRKGPIRISVHLHVNDLGSNQARSAIRSVINQDWPHWHLIITLATRGTPDLVPNDARMTILPELYSNRSDALRAVLEDAATDYLVPLSSDCQLPSNALAAFATAIGGLSDTSTPILYGDQDEVLHDGRRVNPWFKPGWDLDMFLAQDYVSSSCAIPVAPARAAIADLPANGECLAVYALLLTMTVSLAHAIVHLDRVTVSTPVGHWQRTCPERLECLRRQLGTKARIQVRQGPFGTAIIQWPLPAAVPLVSIVIPTRDRLDLLQTCVEGVLSQTKYQNFEIIIADNGSIEAATIVFLERISVDPRVKIVSWPFPYNYSAINNFAVKATAGEFICLLNNDVEIIDGDWLTELMRHACRDGVGAVGARLLYSDRSIQHAGVVVGMGNAAGHAHRGLAEGKPGYFGHALITRGATAVTAACMVVSRRLFDSVGGLDEADLRIAYNDVDFCLKLRAAGASNIYTSQALLIHHESKSRGLDMDTKHLDRYMAELAVLQKRWNTTAFVDPTHHGVLDRSSEIYQTT